MASSLVDHIGVSPTKSNVLLLGASNSDILDAFSHALKESGFWTIRSNIRCAADKYAVCRPEVVVMESEGKLKDLLKAAERILSKNSEAHIILLDDIAVPIPQDAEKIGIDIILRKPIRMERFLASVEALPHTKRRFIAIG